MPVCLMEAENPESGSAHEDSKHDGGDDDPGHLQPGRISGHEPKWSARAERDRLCNLTRADSAERDRLCNLTRAAKVGWAASKKTAAKPKGKAAANKKSNVKKYGKLLSARRRLSGKQKVPGLVDEDAPETIPPPLVAEEAADPNKDKKKKKKKKRGQPDAAEEAADHKKQTSVISPGVPLSDPTLWDAAKFTTAEKHRWELLHLPLTLLRILVCINADLKNLQNFDTVYCVEFFAGVEAIASAFGQEGYHALSYEKHPAPGEVNDRQDLTSTKGFLTALTWFCMCGVDALLWFATVCGTWVVASRSSTKRSSSSPLGDQTLPSVNLANVMTAHSAILIALAYVRDTSWFLEQPLTSMMPEHPLLRHIQLVCHSQGWVWNKITTWMGCFGHDRPKASFLISNRHWVSNLQRSLSSEDRKKFVSTEEAGIVTKSFQEGTGKPQFTGGENLKATQAYTKEFGLAVFQAWEKARSKPSPDIPAVDSGEAPEIMDWAAEVPALDRVLSLFFDAD